MMYVKCWFVLASVPSMVFGTGKTSSQCLLIGPDNFKQMVSQQGVFQNTRVKAGIGGQKFFSIGWMFPRMFLRISETLSHFSCLIESKGPLFQCYIIGKVFRYRYVEKSRKSFFFFTVVGRNIFKNWRGVGKFFYELFL